MLIGILVSAILAGAASVLFALALEVGLALVAVGYVAGGLVGCMLFLRLAVGQRPAEVG